jgi:hypothetical protein
MDRPADPGGDVDTVMNATQKLAAADALDQARVIAERAVDIKGEDRKGRLRRVEELFGNRMSKP